MYLSRIKLDTTRRETKRAVASPQIMHASVEACYDANGRNLWRLDYLKGEPYLLLVSENVPDFGDFSKQFCKEGTVGESKPYLPIISQIKAGQKLHFRIKGNTVSSKAGEKDKRGNVVPCRNEREKMEWLTKKAAANGFSLGKDSFELTETGKQKFWRESNQVELTYGIFEGLLEVTDTELFATALTQGIGRAKAYGCGLLTVMSVKLTKER